ncbi:hypothetical protein [Microbacterium maritypicum]|uniref:hypothetical protein n=1 Tax=Microbacterium maritypicum TaxID=33918 RepID=UPI00296F182C|nr:hypothetical protein [Microbacterium liquefaciens]
MSETHGAFPATTASRKAAPPPKPAIAAASSPLAIACCTEGSAQGSAAVVAATLTGGTCMTATGTGIGSAPEEDTGPEPIESRMPMAVRATPIGNAGPRIGDRGAAC